MRLLRAFQDAGHVIVIVVGNFTGRIGDPSGRNKARPLVDGDELDRNATTYIAQLGRVLDESKLEVTRNADWLESLDLAQLITLLSHATLGQVISRDDFRSRTAAGRPVALHEIIYPYLQGYDSIAVRADVEVGGTDQLYAFQAARHLQPLYGQPAECAVMTPLLRGLDGVQKMSKSLGNHVGLTDAPEEMFGKVMSIPDDLIEEFLRLASSFTLAEIDEFLASIASGGNPMVIKLELARNITALYHDEAAAGAAQDHFDRTIRGKGEADYETTDLELVPDVVSSLLIQVGAASSRSEARRLIEQGGVALNDERVVEDHSLDPTVLHGLRLRVGKRRRYLLHLPG
jgi:tyrosyl-tRNA synthetase